MQSGSDMSIGIKFEGSDPEVGAAARALTDTLKGATSLQRATIEPQLSPAPEGAQGPSVMDGLTLLVESGLLTYSFGLIKEWAKAHRGRHDMTFTVACNNNSTVITQVVRSDDDIVRLLERVKQNCQ